MKESLDYEQAKIIKKAVMETFGVNLHFHDGCGGQYFSLDEANEEIARFVLSFCDENGFDARSQNNEYFMITKR